MTTKEKTAAKKDRAVKQEIARRERLFQRASNAERRVLIAKDVLRMLREKKVRTTHRAFLNPCRSGVTLGTDGFQQQFLAGKFPKCSVCGIGSLMLSCILFNNEATYAEVYASGYMGGLANDIHRRTVPGGLHKYFSSDQLKLIENAFERGHGAFEYSSVPNKNRAIAFGNKHGSDIARLIAVMKNIIKHTGTFVP